MNTKRMQQGVGGAVAMVMVAAAGMGAIGCSTSSRTPAATLTPNSKHRTIIFV